MLLRKGHTENSFDPGLAILYFSKRSHKVMVGFVVMLMGINKKKKKKKKQGPCQKVKTMILWRETPNDLDPPHCVEVNLLICLDDEITSSFFVPT